MAGGDWQEVQGRRQGARGVWCVAGSGWHILTEIIISVDKVVRYFSLVCPPRHNFMMADGHGVENCSLRFCKKGEQLDLGKSKSRTQLSLWKLEQLSPQFWYVWAFDLGLKVMMAMVMVLKAISQVGWLYQCQCHSFSRLKASYWLKLPQTQSFHMPKSVAWRPLLLPQHGPLEQLLKQALKEAFKHQLAILCIHCNNVYSTTITPGSKDRYWYITDFQL